MTLLIFAMWTGCCWIQARSKHSHLRIVGFKLLRNIVGDFMNVCFWHIIYGASEQSKQNTNRPN